VELALEEPAWLQDVTVAARITDNPNVEIVATNLFIPFFNFLFVETNLNKKIKYQSDIVEKI